MCSMSPGPTLSLNNYTILWGKIQAPKAIYTSRLWKPKCVCIDLTAQKFLLKSDGDHIAQSAILKFITLSSLILFREQEKCNLMLQEIQEIRTGLNGNLIFSAGGDFDRFYAEAIDFAGLEPV